MRESPNETKQELDREGSFLLGEADGDSWVNQAGPGEAIELSMLMAEDIGGRDILGRETASFLREQGDGYQRRDPRLDLVSYYEGFLSAVKRRRQHHTLSFVGSSTAWRKYSR